MKIQCSCGAKYNIEVTPDMAQGPVHFVCSGCGLDASDYVTTLVHRELAFSGIPVPPQPTPAGMSNIAPPPPGHAPLIAAPLPTAAPVASAVPVAAAVAVAAPAEAPASSPGRLRVHVAAPAQPAASEAQPADTGEFTRCLKHGGEPALERCYVCSKPICPKCMALFGYVCSPLCKNKAEAQGIAVPVYEGQNSVIQAKQRRKNLYVILSATAGVVSLLGLWIWYAFIGSTPHKVYSVRFTESAGSGQSAFAGKNQLIFLHGATLARHDLKDKKEVWSRYLVDKGELEKEITEAIKENKSAIDRANSNDPDNVPGVLDPKELRRDLEETTAAGLSLRVVGQNIWVIAPNKLTLFDWDSGQPSKEIALTNDYGSVLHRGDEVVVLSGESDKQHATYINLATKETREEDVTGLPKSAGAKVDLAKGGRGGAKGGGLPSLSGKDAGKPLDPAKVAQQAQKLSTPGKIALPAVLSSSIHNRKTLEAMNEGPDTPQVTAAHQSPEEPFMLVPTPDGFMRFTSKLLEEKIVTRQAMKAPPAKSALNGPVNVTQTAAVANEILNELQRSAGGDTVEEDESRYQVKLGSADGKNEWSGEVIGPPHLHPLKTVNVLTMNKKIMVFDKQNKKLWESALTYNVGSGELEDPGLDSGVGQGPCVERNNRLYVFDQGVLTAFDLATGNALWRVPSVGITGLFFDDKDMLYLNTTDASPETIKYSRQIDITQMPSGQLLKIDPKDGKVVFKVSPPGPVTYVSGKFIYCVQSSGPGSDEGGMDSVMGMPGMGGMRPFIRIKRLKPSNGKEMWEHYESRGPIDVQFDKNSIRLIFKKEVEVLKFLSL
jgi:hypothetical protein